MKKTLFLITSCMFIALSAANGRIAVVDLGRVFKEYHRSRIAEETIRRQSDAYREYMMQLNTQLQRLEKEFQTARFDAQNIALSNAEHNKAEEKLRNLQLKVKEKRAEIAQYGKSRSEALQQLSEKKRREIIAEISAEIRRRAAAEGYDFVFDSSGHTTNDQPAVLLFPPANDLTQSIIRELNRTATPQHNRK